MSTEDPGSANPFARRGFVAAVVVVGVIVVLGIFVLVSSLLAPAKTPPITEPTTAPTQSAADASVCGLEGFEATSSLTKAPEVKWELVGTVAVPVDPTVGPGAIDDDGFRSCFAHTAEGALFATINYFALSSDARTFPRIPELIEPGPGRDAAASAAGGEQTANTRLQVAGFKVNSYTGEEAVIDVVWSVTTSGGRLVSLPIVLHWVDGDWKIALTEKGQLPFSSAPLENLGGYIPWAGV